jgi:hypothetical protein
MDSRESGICYVNDTVLQLALRELQRTFTSPRLLTGMAAVALVLGVSGPFGTSAILGLAQRLVYWLAMVVITYGSCRPLALVVVTLLRRRLGQGWGPTLLTGLLVGTPVFAVVTLVNLVAIGNADVPPVELWVNCTLITMAVIVVGTLIQQAQPSHDNATPDAIRTGETAPPSPPAPGSPLLERIPHPLRGRLVALTVEDHYVEVITEKGKALVLMRLSDAIKETGAAKGVQIHRSHWVALDAVKGVSRADGKVAVELSNGALLPVSRGYLLAARAAGLLI